MKKLYTVVLLGTARKGRQSTKVANYVMEMLKKYDVKAELFDVQSLATNYTIPSWVNSKETRSWREAAKNADAFIFIVPEYNHGYPGEFKIVLDSAYKEYEKKPVALCGVSSGVFGGARIIEHVMPVLIEFGLVPSKNNLHFSSIETLFDKNGKIKDKEYNKRAKNMLDELFLFAKVLKEVREK